MKQTRFTWKRERCVRICLSYQIGEQFRDPDLCDSDQSNGVINRGPDAVQGKIFMAENGQRDFNPALG
jgi:hypothetical protein